MTGLRAPGKLVYGSSPSNGPDTILFQAAPSRFFRVIDWPSIRQMLVFLTRFFSRSATREFQERLHFCHIKIRFQVRKVVCAVPPYEKMICSLPGKELCQIEPEMGFP